MEYLMIDDDCEENVNGAPLLAIAPLMRDAGGGLSVHAGDYDLVLSLLNLSASRSRPRTIPAAAKKEATAPTSPAATTTHRSNGIISPRDEKKAGKSITRKIQHMLASIPTNSDVRRTSSDINPVLRS
jgi:hypothetical protein